jgi:multicomponent Na+:H+ antiporter subunit D
VRALAQDELKKRLAYSTVSQVSYIVLGAAIFGPVATIGGIVHLFHQGIMKITLFFAAGNYAEALGIHRISKMNGVGRKMPWTTLAFTVGALGMIGLPPLTGYVSKWYLQKGGIEGGEAWVSLVLSTSSLLNAAYFLPILYRAWFKEGDATEPRRRPYGWMLVLPPVATALLVVMAGVFAESPYSPLEWAKMIAEREYVK